MAATETFVPDRLNEMPLADLKPIPNQPRRYFDAVALNKLSASVVQRKVIVPNPHFRQK